MKEVTRARRVASRLIAETAEQASGMTLHDPHVQWSQQELRNIEDWASKREIPLGRSEAIRHLVALGLNVEEESPRSSNETQRVSASAMAGKQIDHMNDAEAPVEEQHRRKRRLVNGPPEFRDARLDLPKSKDSK